MTDPQAPGDAVAGHTALPWRIHTEVERNIYRTESVYICTAGDWPRSQVARVNTQDGLKEREANAALIVSRVNGWDGLVAELTALSSSHRDLGKRLAEAVEAISLRDTMLTDAFEAVLQLFGDDALTTIADRMRLINRSRENNAGIDALESALASTETER